MGSRLFALIAGSITGMLLGGMLIAAICVGLETYAGVQFTKEPLGLILIVGIPVGGVLGGLVGLWTSPRRSAGDDLD
jgi:hypothetical protein